MVSFTCNHPATDDSTPLTVAVTIDAVDADGDGDTDLRITLDVTNPDQQADLRGFFFNFDNAELGDDTLVATGTHVTDSAFDYDGVPSLSAPPEGGANPLAFEAAVEIGDSGIGMGDDIDSTTFTISSATDQNLSLDLLEGEQILIRAGSVLQDNGVRGGSSKIVCEVPDSSTPGEDPPGEDPPGEDPPGEDPPGEDPPPNEFSFEKDLDTSIEFNLSSNTDITLEKDVDIDVNVDSDVDLDGNFASATFSSEAIGENTFAEADVHVLAIEGQLSSVDGSLTAAAG